MNSNRRWEYEGSVEEIAMNADIEHELKTAIGGGIHLGEILELIRRLKANGLSKEHAQYILESLRQEAPNEETEDRILEVLDFIGGFCSPRGRIWED
jgi:hypothetical protein